MAIPFFLAERKIGSFFLLLRGKMDPPVEMRKDDRPCLVPGERASPRALIDSQSIPFPPPPPPFENAHLK